MYLENSVRLWRRIARARSLDVHFELALRSYEAKDRGAMVRHMEAIVMLPEGGTGCMEYIALTWRLKLLDGDKQAAVETARLCAHLYPQDIDSLLEFGQLLIDIGRHEEALQVLENATRQAPDDADIWYELGIAAEHCEQWDLRYDAFHRVWSIERNQESEGRHWISEERASEIVELALQRLPGTLRSAIGNVAVIVEDYPDEWVLAEGVVDPRILGLFDGPTHASEHSVDSVIDGPSRIYLFRRNIERMCHSVFDAEHQITLTVLHELGHYFGFDESDLERLGLN